MPGADSGVEEISDGLDLVRASVAASIPWWNLSANTADHYQ
jgi:hypothetical protein